MNFTLDATGTYTLHTLYMPTGSVDPEECMMTVNRITLEFFDSFLKGKGEFSVPEQIEIS